jgi:hypothetical protein
MRAKVFFYGMALMSSLLILAGPSAAADGRNDKDRPALSGGWVLKGGETRLEFDGKKMMKIFPHGDNLVIAVICDYTADKDGSVKATISGFEGKDEVKKMVKELLPVGTQFRFRWKVTDDNARLDEVKGDKAEHLQSHLEGEYSRKK